jgi:hypothetical protein
VRDPRSMTGVVPVHQAGQRRGQDPPISDRASSGSTTRS